VAKVLLVDTNFSSAPIYAELCCLADEVHVVGGNPSDCLAKSSKYYWNLNYADTEALLHLIEQQAFDYIVPGCTDRSYTSCSVVSKGRYPGVESEDVDHLLNNKLAFRSLAAQLDLPVPKLIEGTPDSCSWPLIVKPVDSFSGKGITVLAEVNQSRLVAAIELARGASTSGHFLIEEFVAGGLYSHSAFLCKGKVSQDFIVQENCTANQFVVDTSRVILEPSVVVLETLRRSIETLAAALKLKDGLIHTQFIMSGERVWLIEITRRCPGDLYSQLIELSTGFSYVGNYVRPFLGLPMLDSESVTHRTSIMRHTITTPSPQSFGYLKFNRELLIERWVSLSVVGDQLLRSPAGRIGIIFVKGNSEDDFDAFFDITCRRELYDIIE
jgi:biotin carboxylase